MKSNPQAGAAIRLATARIVLAAAATIAAAGVQAQSVDYNGLEQLFGEPITTSVSGKPQKASDAAASVVILTQDDIRRSGADNIPDILRFVTGVDVRSYGIMDADVGIRGYNQPNNPRLLVMVNGRQIYLDDYGYVAWSALPVQLDEIRQIEVVKGPNSALFGFNAAGGVINIITTDPIKDSTNVATVRTGTQSLAEASVVGTAHLSDNAGIRLSAGGFSLREFEPRGLNSFDLLGHSSPRNGAFNLQGSWQVRPGIEVTAEGGVVDSTNTLYVPEGNYVSARYRINTTRLGFSADTRAGLVNLDFYRNQAHDGYISGLATEELVNTVYVVKVSDLLKLNPANTVRLGLEYRSNAATSPAFGGTIGYKVYSADAMWDWAVTQSFSLINAVRLDYLALQLNGLAAPGTGLTVAQYDSSTFIQPSFNSGAVWKVTDYDTIRLTAARGLQVPSLVDYAFQYVEPGVGTIYYGNPTLAPTSVWNFELGYDRNVPQIDSILRTALFYQVNDNLLAPSFAFPLAPQANGSYSAQSNNIGSSDEVGIELGIKGKTASGWRWDASYSFASITDKLVSGLTAVDFAYRRGTPQNTVILGGGYSLDRWEFDVQGRWQSEFQDFKAAAGVGFEPVEVSNYVDLNARIGYRVSGNLTLSATGQQFNVSRLMQTAGTPVERRLLLALTAHF